MFFSVLSISPIISYFACSMGLGLGGRAPTFPPKKPLVQSLASPGRAGKDLAESLVS